MARPNKHITTALKLLISGVLVYFIFSKIAIADIGKILQNTNVFYLSLALLCFVGSKIIAAFRGNLYFHQLGLYFTQISHLKLYFLGMFYNLFLPGGIGGDAYKGYLIKKDYEVPTKKVISVLVLDRLSGMLLLFVLACGLLMFIPMAALASWKLLFALAIPAAVVVFWFLNKRFFAFVLPVFWKSFAYSALVQLAQLAAIWCIMKSLGITDNYTAYLLLFLISSIVSVIPLTLGGIGSRELTFFYGAALLELQQDISVSISVLFFLITAVVSLTGAWYHFKKATLQITPS